MTDGIIQEVFKQWKEKHDFFAWQLTKMEQELIERVKEIINDNFRCACVDTDDIRRALIGDNA